MEHGGAGVERCGYSPLLLAIISVFLFTLFPYLSSPFTLPSHHPISHPHSTPPLTPQPDALHARLRQAEAEAKAARSKQRQAERDVAEKSKELSEATKALGRAKGEAEEYRRLHADAGQERDSALRKIQVREREGWGRY